MCVEALCAHIVLGLSSKAGIGFSHRIALGLLNLRLGLVEVLRLLWLRAVVTPFSFKVQASSWTSWL